MKTYLHTTLAILSSFVLLSACTQTTPSPKNTQHKIKALIIDGQNNHGNWPKSSVMMQANLEQTGLFNVDIQRTQFTWKGENLIKKFPIDGPETTALEQPKTDPNFIPNFKNYDVVISNFGWKAADLPKQTETALADFIENGGGLVVVHAADNSWPKWNAFNKMIGLGGWGGRNEKDGPWVYYDKNDKLIRNTQPGHGGGHGPQREFSIKVRESNHPVTQGLPPVFMHAKDELYEKLRGPAENMTILATAFSNENPQANGRHEPVVMVINYGKGRVFHTTLGHGDPAHESVSLITLIQRGTEWAATGQVSQAVPADFPSATQSQRRPFNL